nr:glycosyltransferase family 2 protein [Candidatus Desulfacyla euxinica]
MPDQADISIIIPVFNGAKYIKKCLDSLLNQELKPCEIIVVDNGSTDDTVALVGNYKKIYLLEEKVPGAGMARNKGAGKARGLILAFIDADCQAKRDSPKSAIGFGWVSSLRFVAA